jgi:hypothetical protein
MFPLECGKKHLINYKESCCVKHLIEMNFHAEAQTLTHKYSKLLFLTLNHFYKLSQLNFENMKLDTARIFLEIMSKHISHFYFLNKFEYSKILIKIALKASEETLFREHPDIIIRKSAIYNNLSCVYERTGSLSKANRYIKIFLKYAQGNLDKAIVLNNIARINMKLRDRSGAYNAMRNCFELIKEESKKITNHLFKERGDDVINSLVQNNLTNNSQNRIQLVSYLYLNYGSLLQTLCKENEAIEVLRKGYEFSLSTLGEFHINLNKFAIKLQNLQTIPKGVNIGNNSRDYARRGTVDSKYDSDLDYMSIMDNTAIMNNTNTNINTNPNVLTLSKSIKNIRFVNHSNSFSNTMIIPNDAVAITPSTTPFENKFRTAKKMDKKNTLSTVHASSANPILANNSFHANEMNELKLKMDILLQKFDQINLEREKSNTNNNSNSANKNESDAKGKDSTTESKNSFIRKEKIKNLFQPALKRLITSEDIIARRGSTISNKRKDSLNVTQEMINDLVNEFEAEGVNNNMSNMSVISKSDKVDDGSKRGRNYNRNMSNKFKLANGNLTTELLTNENKERDYNRSMSNIKPRRTLKEMFSKVIPTTKLQAIEAKTKAPSGGMFAQMINSIIDEPITPIPKHSVSMKRPEFNDFMDKSDDIIAKVDTSNANGNGQGNTNEGHNNNILAEIENSLDIEVRDKGKGNEIITKEKDKDGNTRSEFKPLFFSKLKQSAINNAEASASRKDNADSDNTKEHLQSIAKTFKINVILDETKEDYNFKPLFFSKKEIERRAKEITEGTTNNGDSIINNTSEKGGDKEKEKEKPTSPTNKGKMKDHLQSIAKTFKINVILDKTEDSYECQNLFYKKDEKQEDNLITTTGNGNNSSIEIGRSSNNSSYNTIKETINTITSSTNKNNTNSTPSNIQRGFSVNIILDNCEDSYACTNLFYKKDEAEEVKNKNSNSNNIPTSNNSNIITNIHNSPNFASSNNPSNNSNKKTSPTEVDNSLINLTKNYIDNAFNKVLNKSIEEEREGEPKFTADMMKDIEDDLILKTIEISSNNLSKNISSNNFLKNKTKKEFDIKKHFENLISSHKDRTNPPVFTIIRELNNELYKIAISYGMKDSSGKGIFLRLYKVNKNNSQISSHITENFISFEKLKSFSTKIAIFNSLPDNKDINLITSLDLFIEKIFIYHCYIFSKDNSGNILLGVLTRPLGICFNRAYEFTFLKTSCIIDIFILQSKQVKFFIYNKSNDFMSISFNWELDQNCFNSLFNEFEINSNFSLPHFDEEKLVKSYRTIDDKHLTKNGFITEIIIGVQKMLKFKFNDENLKFDFMVSRSQGRNGVFRTSIKESFRIIELWAVGYEEKRSEFEVDFYTLKKVQSKNFF